MRQQRIILDTNLWISFLISKKLDQLEKLIEEKTIVLLYSDELISEIIRVTSIPNSVNILQTIFLNY
jgi:uncharacterized protein